MISNLHRRHLCVCDAQVQLADLGIEKDFDISIAQVTSVKVWSHIAKVAIQNLNVAVYDLERYELVVLLTYSSDKEERGIPAIDDLGV
jgi:hypothetical protein